MIIYVLYAATKRFQFVASLWFCPLHIEGDAIDIISAIQQSNLFKSLQGLKILNIIHFH